MRPSKAKKLFRKMREKPLLTEEDIKARFAFATKYRHKTAGWWMKAFHAAIDGKLFKVYLNGKGRFRGGILSARGGPIVLRGHRCSKETVPAPEYFRLWQNMFIRCLCCSAVPHRPGYISQVPFSVTGTVRTAPLRPFRLGGAT